MHDDEVRAELLQRQAFDQDARRPAMADHAAADRAVVDRIAAVDRDNTAWLVRVIDTRGWPLRAHVGDEAAVAAWLIVQHADHDPAFQRRCLELLQALPDGEVEPARLAMLVDRVLVNGGRPQRYGTQVRLVDGRAVVLDTEDDGDVDERRAAVGLEPLATYLARFNG